MGLSDFREQHDGGAVGGLAAVAAVDDGKVSPRLAGLGASGVAKLDVNVGREGVASNRDDVADRLEEHVTEAGVCWCTIGRECHACGIVHKESRRR